MPYDDVPQRLADGDAVPRAEIIGYYAPTTDIQISLGCEVLTMAGIMEKVFEDDTVKFRLTPLGLDVRSSLITRLEGDCPDCPDCP